MIEMGNSKYLDSLSVEDKLVLSKKLWDAQDHKCFICGKEIELDIQSTNIDHIKPLVNGGKDDERNFAITHEHCNKSKKDADLEVARKLCELDQIKEEASSKHESTSLKHVLHLKNGSKFDFKYKVENGQLVYSFDEGGDTNIHRA